MKRLKQLFLLPLLALALFSCQPATKTPEATTNVSEWTKKISTVRSEYPPVHLLKELSRHLKTHLPRLKELGVDILWIMRLTRFR